MSPLVNVMTAVDPTARPDAATIVDKWQTITRNIGRWKRLQPLKLSTEYEDAAAALVRGGPLRALHGGHGRPQLKSDVTVLRELQLNARGR